MAGCEIPEVSSINPEDILECSSPRIGLRENSRKHYWRYWFWGGRMESLRFGNQGFMWFFLHYQFIEINWYHNIMEYEHVLNDSRWHVAIYLPFYPIKSISWFDLILSWFSSVFPEFFMISPSSSWFSHGFPLVFALLHPPAAPRRRNVPVLRVAGGQELLEKLPRALRRVQVFVERRRDRGEMFAAYFTGQRWTLISGVKT
jgi:hypothetical protein